MLHRQEITPDITLWSASANGQVLYWHTRSDDTLTERPIFTDSVMGVELVDSQGQVVARAFTDRRPPLGTR